MIDFNSLEDDDVPALNLADVECRLTTRGPEENVVYALEDMSPVATEILLVSRVLRSMGW